MRCIRLGRPYVSWDNFNPTSVNVRLAIQACPNKYLIFDVTWSMCSDIFRAECGISALGCECDIDTSQDVTYALTQQRCRGMSGEGRMAHQGILSRSVGSLSLKHHLVLLDLLDGASPSFRARKPVALPQRPDHQ